MRAVLQRVRSAAVSIGGETRRTNREGLSGASGDRPRGHRAGGDFLLDKILGLRVFEDEAGKMNRSLTDCGGELLVVSQFTLYADCRKGRRPSFTGAARPETAVPLYERFLCGSQSRGRAHRMRGIRRGHARQPAKRRPRHHPAGYRRNYARQTGKTRIREEPGNVEKRV